MYLIIYIYKLLATTILRLQSYLDISLVAVHLLTNIWILLLPSYYYYVIDIIIYTLSYKYINYLYNYYIKDIN